MDAATYAELCRLIYERSGIHLTEGKEALVAARITKRMLALGMRVDFRRYLDRLRDDQSGREAVYMIDAISTNQTSFFREPSHFKFTCRWLHDRLARGQRRFRFWSAGCSTGEEPYSLAMTIADMADEAIDWRILATDISTAALRVGMAAAYDADRLSIVAADLRHRHFIPVDQRSQSFRVSDSLRNRVLFRRLNLAQPPFPQRGPLDLIFCRNVMIYFDEPVRRRLLDEFQKLLRPGGCLVIGHCESLFAVTRRFQFLEPSIYVKG